MTGDADRLSAATGSGAGGANAPAGTSATGGGAGVANAPAGTSATGSGAGVANAPAGTSATGSAAASASLTAPASASPAAAPAAAIPQPTKEDGDHLRVVPPRRLSPAQRRRRTRALLLAGAGLAVMVAFGLVYLHVVLAQRQFALDRLTQKVQTDRSTYERLRVQAAQLGSPANIISRAEGQLGMRQPASVTYLTPTVTIGGSAASASSESLGAGAAQAPAGVDDWPQIKAQLAGSP